MDVYKAAHYNPISNRFSGKVHMKLISTVYLSKTNKLYAIDICNMLTV